MHQGGLVFSLLLLSYLCLALAVPHIQYTVPRDPFLQEEIYDGSELKSESLEESFASAESAGRLRTALRALLELNDGELRALLKGVPAETVKEDISPSTAFILQGSRNRFERLKALISNEETKTKLEGDMQIARRRKKVPVTLSSEGKLDEKAVEISGEADSLLGALTQLSASLGGENDVKSKRRERKSEKKHKRSSFHSSTKAQKMHYSYWLRSEECPKSVEGIPMLYCPSPTADGESLCINDHDLCDGHSHCPEHEDEEPMACLFFKAMRNYVDLLTSAFLLSRRS